MVIGDLNARVGENNRALGSHGLDVLTPMERDSLIYVWRAN